jgi:hypothetical protein
MGSAFEIRSKMKTKTVMLKTLANGNTPPNVQASNSIRAEKRLANAKIIIGRTF